MLVVVPGCTKCTAVIHALGTVAEIGKVHTKIRGITKINHIMHENCIIISLQ